MNTSKAANSAARIRALAVWEFRQMIGNGEQILLAFVIPSVLLIAVRTWLSDADVLPAIVTVSALATAFTSLAIGTGFERRSGALQFLATTPLSRIDIMAAKIAAQGALALASLTIVIGLGLILGEGLDPWRAVIAIPCALIAFGSWGFWLGGRFRAEAVLAIANAAFILLIAFGGILVAAEALPTPVDFVVAALPTALLTTALQDGSNLALNVAGLLLWGMLGALLVRRTFRWQ